MKNILSIREMKPHGADRVQRIIHSYSNNNIQLIKRTFFLTFFFFSLDESRSHSELNFIYQLRLHEYLYSILDECMLLRTISWLFFAVRSSVHVSVLTIRTKAGEKVKIVIFGVCVATRRVVFGLLDQLFNISHINTLCMPIACDVYFTKTDGLAKWKMLSTRTHYTVCEYPHLRRDIAKVMENTQTLNCAKCD